MFGLKEYKQEDYFDVAIFFIVAFYPDIYKYIWAVFSKLGLGVIASNLNYLVWAAIILVFLPVISKRVHKRDIIACVSLALVWSIFSIFPWQNAFTWTRYFELVTGVLPYFILGRVYRYSEKHKNFVSFIAGATLILAMIYTVFFVIDDEGMFYDDMFASYNLLYSILILLSSFFDEKKYIYRVLGVIGIVYMLLLGTRGPVLCVGVFIMMMLCKKIGSVKTITVALIAVVSINIYISSPSYEKLLENLSVSVAEYGFSTRIIDLLRDDGILRSSGRDDIQSHIISEIKRNPFEVRGPYSDWILTSKHYNYEIKDIEEKGTYAHNFFLEMWTHYGIFFGSIIIAFVMINVIKLIIKVDKDKCFIAYAVVCAGFVMLMLSSSYLLKESFFFLMGICFNESFIKNIK